MYENIVRKVIDKKNVIKNPKEDAIPSYEEQVEDILTNFNFENVERIMKMKIRAVWDDDFEKIIRYDSWKIADSNYKLYQPTVEDLIKNAAELLADVSVRGNKSEVIWTATGPFKATNRYGILELEFVVESWSID